MSVVYGIDGDNKCKRRVVAYSEILELSATTNVTNSGTGNSTVAIHNFAIPSDFTGDFYIIALECHSMDDDSVKKWLTGSNYGVSFSAERNIGSNNAIYISAQIYDQNGYEYYAGEQVEIRIVLMKK